MSRERLNAISKLAVIATVAVILLTTLTPFGTGDGDSSGCQFGLPCFLGHLVLFGILGVGVAGLYSTSDAARRAPRRVLAMTFIVIWVFAAADELAQDRVAGRSPEFEDWLADMIGAVLGIVLGSMLLRELLGRGRR